LLYTYSLITYLTQWYTRSAIQQIKKRLSTMRLQTKFLKILFGCGLLLLFSLQPSRVRGITVQQTTSTSATLTMSNITTIAGSKVTVPVKFQRGATNVDTLVFSIDYDQRCLTVSASDMNNDTIPDAISIFAPASFFHWATFSAADAEGELDFAISSLSALADADPLVTIEFTTTCVSGSAFVNFATAPEPSFGANGMAVPGETTNGAVSIATPPVTPTPASSVLLVSVGDTSGTIDGLSFQDEDILAYHTAGKQWSMVFDGSDVGWGKVDLEAFDVLADGSFLLTPSKKLMIPGVGEVLPSDIMRFIPTTLGSTTAGVWEWYFDGSDVGLNSNGEYIDAIAFDPSGRLLISSEGAFDAGGVKGNDEDLFTFTKLSLGATTAGSWALYFDGSRMALTKNDEDIDAVWIKLDGDIYLSTKGKFAAASSHNAIGGDQNDVFICKPLAIGAATNCTFAAFFDGDSVRFKYNVDDIGLALVDQLRPFTDFAIAAADETDSTQYTVGGIEPRALMIDPELSDDDLDRDELVSQKVFLPFVAQ